MTPTREFQVNDIVRVGNGKAEWSIMGVPGGRITRGISTGYYLSAARRNMYVPQEEASRLRLVRSAAVRSMINDDTFTALAEIWTEYTEEVTASLDRHMDRLNDITEAVMRDDIPQEDGKKAARRSRLIHEDRREFLRRYYVGKLSDELAAWMAA